MKVRSITVTVGPVTFSPVSYNTFVVGPLSMTAEIQEGDDEKEVIADMTSTLRKMLAQQHATMVADYAKSLDYNDRAVKEFMRSKGRG